MIFRVFDSYKGVYIEDVGNLFISTSGVVYCLDFRHDQNLFSKTDYLAEFSSYAVDNNKETIFENDIVFDIIQKKYYTVKREDGVIVFRNKRDVFNSMNIRDYSQKYFHIVGNSHFDLDLSQKYIDWEDHLKSDKFKQ